MQTATLDEFFGEVCSEDTEAVPFEIPTANGPRVVWVQEITQRCLEEMRGEVQKAGRKADGWDPDAQARLIVACVADAKTGGRPLFRPEHVARLSSGRVRYVEPLARVCAHVNRIDISTDEMLKKNSGTSPASDSLPAFAVTLAG